MKRLNSVASLLGCCGQRLACDSLASARHELCVRLLAGSDDSLFSFQPPKTKSKKAERVKSSAVVDGLSTEEMSKDQVRANTQLTLASSHQTVFQ